MSHEKLYQMAFADVYPHYVNKAERKERSKADVDELIEWLMGYSLEELNNVLERKWTFREFITNAPRLNPSRHLIKGVVCGVRVEEIEDPLMREIRYLDKLIDELARGKKMEKIKRS